MNIEVGELREVLDRVERLAKAYGEINHLMVPGLAMGTAQEFVRERAAGMMGVFSAPAAAAEPAKVEHPEAAFAARVKKMLENHEGASDDFILMYGVNFEDNIVVGELRAFVKRAGL